MPTVTEFRCVDEMEEILNSQWSVDHVKNVNWFDSSYNRSSIT